MSEPRAPHAREDVDRGVARCVELMTSGRWVTGRSYEDVAKEHGVSPETVRTRWAPTASRLIRAAMNGDLDDIRARMLATLDVIVARSMGCTETNPFGDNPAETVSFIYNPKQAVDALELQSKILGLQKTTVRVQPVVGTLTREEHLAALEQLKADIAEEEKRAREEAGDAHRP